MTYEQSKDKRDRRKRAAALGLVGLGIAGIAAASAATLAIQTGGTDNVAAGSENIVVAGPGTERVAVDFVPQGTLEMSWNLTDTRPVAVEVSGLEGSTGGTVEIAVFKEAIDRDQPAGAGTKLWSGSATIAGDVVRFESTPLTGGDLSGDGVAPSVSIIVTDEDA